MKYNLTFCFLLIAHLVSSQTKYRGPAFKDTINDGFITDSVTLEKVTIVGGAGRQYEPISSVDIRMRDITSSQDVLRMVPGLFIGQHAGGGKAEQIFLRGFDIDHGTDINIMVDGTPVNMVSHAHGQGYADLHFLIPELIQKVDFKKGPYYADKGNFTTTGFVNFNTFNFLPHSSVKLEAGMFNTVRTVAMLDLLSEQRKKAGQSAYIGTEYLYTKGYFDHPQHLNRFNIFGKYHHQLSKRTTLNVSASTFSSKWNASGQIPDRAVKEGRIGFYGAIDPDEGGSTARTNANAIVTTTLNSKSNIRTQLFYTHYKFDLFSNFTFFKEDPVNGDQIRQRESRNMYGVNTSYNNRSFIGNTEVNSEIGVHARFDRTADSELSRTKNRNLLMTPLALGDITENNIAAYINETISFSNWFNINAGIRVDQFYNRYVNKLENNHEASASASIVSPKVTVSYHPTTKTQFYISAGKGFHSNDTRVVVPRNGREILPAAYGSDVGVIFKPAKELLVHFAGWYLWMEQEFVYVGDESIVEPSGKSRRVGLDLSARYMPWRWLYFDMDMNYSHARAIDGEKGSNHIPLAPKFTSIGGITFTSNLGLNASVRYRYMSDRPANEDNSMVAKGYFITDAIITYTKKRYELGITVQNLFNSRWKETQFETESRLFDEPQPVSEIHFTPGTPFFIKAGVTVKF